MKKFDNFKRHMDTLARSRDQDLTNDFVISGIIEKFSIQFELSWKVLKELLRYEGAETGGFGSPRETLKAAYRYFGFLDEDLWLAMLRDRNNTAHIYDGDAARALADRIIGDYIPEFERLRRRIEERYGTALDEMA